MALNPVHFARKVIDQFLRYQLTAFPITDDYLAQQAQALFRGKVSTPLVKGPYLSLSKSFEFGPRLDELAAEGKVHPALAGIAEFPCMFAHQHKVLAATQAGRHCLVSAGTGSGKTEAFLYPIIDHCLRARDAGEPEGITAILVYPMNALAIDQLGRLRRLLAGTGVSFGMYIGSTPADDKEAGGYKRLKQGQGRAEYDRAVRELAQGHEEVVSPWEERVTEAEMRERPPRILLTNVRQLEILMTRETDMGMFRNAPLRFLVFDEAHTYGGVAGAETACLIRRLRAFCGRTSDEVLCIGTSATLVDPETGEEAGAQFAERFFGVPAGQVALVGETYRDIDWPKQRDKPTAPPGDTVALLTRILEAVEAEDAVALRRAYAELSGLELPNTGDVYADLYGGLRSNDMAYHASALSAPTELAEATEIVWRRLGREPAHSEAAQAELLCYLALGAAARLDGNPLMRPKLHYFVKGLEGAVAVLDGDPDAGGVRPRLYLSASDAQADFSDRLPSALLPLYVCSSCGQHYFRAWVDDLTYDNGKLSGGQAEGTNVLWAPSNSLDRMPVTFTDRFISELSDEELPDATQRLDRKREDAHVCRYCGAIHRNMADRCSHRPCMRLGPLVPVHAVTHVQEDGTLRTCPSCGELARGFGQRKREPIRPLRAVHVADVHILAQDMLNAADPGHQKLICFADNRQDAAFQAGWMHDHARRYRLRHLVYTYAKAAGRPVSITDIVDHVMGLFAADPDLAHALAPMVYEGRVDEAFGRSVRDNLRYYLRIQLVLELTTSFRQRDSLETWGVARVEYAGLTADDPFVESWSEKLKLRPDELCAGIASLLDIHRRNRLLYDELAPVFARWWREGDEEIMRGYLPQWDFPPKGLKLKREPGDATDKIIPFLSGKARTGTMGFIAKWWPHGNAPDSHVLEEFAREIWRQLTEVWRLLVPVKLAGAVGGQLKGTVGAHQVNAERIGLLVQAERYRCTSCRRTHPRPTPRKGCTAYHCVGQLDSAPPSLDDYNVFQLQQPFSMLSPEEHTAQVPAHRREEVEREFKDPDGRVNCLVATPTLELGVDIGALDMVLMRNVPPQASNYWQRAGRAGREHRMAVVFTYCRRSIHDAYFFVDPTRMLEGRIAPPRFNLKNDIMLRKHMHAAALSELLAVARGLCPEGEVPAAAAGRAGETLRRVLPTYIKPYLYEDDRDFRGSAYDVSPLTGTVLTHQARLGCTLEAVFQAPWPKEARAEVCDEALAAALDGMTESLQAVVTRLHQRMMWAVETRRRLQEREHKGLLDEQERRIRQRCESYLDGLTTHDRRNYTLVVLAQEGFLPGYGADDIGIAAFVPAGRIGRRHREAYQLSRPPAIAIREFVPGNLIYANRARHRVAQYHVPVGEETVALETYTVDYEHRIVAAVAAPQAGYATDTAGKIKGMPICDSDVAFISTISDAEDYRFQAPPGVLGYLHQTHGGGQAYDLAEGRVLRHMHGQRLRLVNVGPADRVARGELGFPICIVCGAVRSPYSSQKELDEFRKRHREICGVEPEPLAITTDAVVDGFVVGSFESRGDAVSAAEGLRLGAEQVLDMEREDLSYIVLPSSGDVGVFLYDPMPGGSGLLAQVLERWVEVCRQGQSVLAGCTAACVDSCYECMRTYYNLPYHRDLDRRRAVALLAWLEERLEPSTPIPPVSGPEAPEGHAKQDNAERLLAILGEYGFPAPDRECTIEIGEPFGTTVPDFSYEDESEGIHIAIYLDGLSCGIHGNAARSQQERIIREQLVARGWDVLEVASSELDDPAAMKRHLRRLAQMLMDREVVQRVAAGVGD